MIPIKRPIWSLPIRDDLITRLADAGCEFLEDMLVECQNKQELRQLISESKIDFSAFLYSPLFHSGVELLKEEQEENGLVVTLSKAIDELLGGGIPTSRITEFVGAPGTGKTQICFQLCVSVQIPKFLGYLTGSAVYVGTNNNFSEKRIREIHVGIIEHCLTVTKNQTLSVEENSILNKFITSDPLLGIQKYSIETVEELRASTYVIEKMLKESKNVRLVIIDSFTFPFYSTEMNLDRTKIISQIMNHLNELALVYRLAVVITNELTTCILNHETKEIIPSLGETFAHFVHNRIVLGKQKSSIHTAVLQKSSEYPFSSAYFQVTLEGVRDVPSLDDFIGSK